MYLPYGRNHQIEMQRAACTLRPRPTHVYPHGAHAASIGNVRPQQEFNVRDANAAYKRCLRIALATFGGAVLSVRLQARPRGHRGNVVSRVLLHGISSDSITRNAIWCAILGVFLNHHR
jgi:hypothetical protein